MQLYHIYRHHATDPFFNMAFDETMLEYVLGRPDVILLRLYTWQPGAITVGLNQDLDRALEMSRLGGTPLIRRITGGRAVYHDPSELTYSVAVNPAASGLAAWRGSISDVYLNLAQALQVFVRALGRRGRVVRTAHEPDRAPSVIGRQPCFASAARYELMVEGGKAVASAQRRIGDALLQHGSIKLDGIAGHLALPGLRSTDNVLQPIAELRFEQCGEAFHQVWEQLLGRTGESEKPDLEGSDRFLERLSFVRQCPLDRRDTFEQSGDQKSL